MNEKSLNFINFLFVFLPFLQPYKMPGTSINLQVITLFVLSIYLFFIHKGDIRWPHKYFPFFVYSLFVPILGYFEFFDVSHTISSYIPIISFTFAFLVLMPVLEYGLLKNWYKKLVYISISFFVLQEIMYHTIGWRIVGMLPFMPLMYEDIPMSEYISMFSTLDRSSSFFLEPAHFSQYLLGYLAIHLEDIEKNDKFFDRDSILISICLFFTFSGNAFILGIVVWSCHFLCSKTSVFNKIFIILVAIFASFNTIDVLGQSASGEKLLKRANSLTSSEEYGESEFIRIYRGWYVYDNVSLSNKILGVGSSNVTCLVDNSPSRILFPDSERYMNNAQTIAMGYGYIGTALFLAFVIGLCDLKKRQNICIVVLFCVMSFIESFWCTSLMLIYLLIPVLKIDPETDFDIDFENEIKLIR